MRVSIVRSSPHWSEEVLTAQVYLDGEKVRGVVEADDVEGWLDVYFRSDKGQFVRDRKTGRPKLERKTGAVTIRLWKPPA